MKIAILGFGAQGQSALEYWGAQGQHEITICDQNESLETPEGTQMRLGSTHLQNLDQFDLIVRSPIVHPRDVVAANSEAILDKVTTNTNEFFKVCPTQNIIGVTGTKGKGTTSTLIAKMLEAAGKRVHLGGNIGTPPLELLKNDIKQEDFVVLELANFQLIDLKYSPPIAVCLMVVPEHLDWHSDVEEYIMAKKQLFRWQNPNDKAIYYAENDRSKLVAEASGGQKIPYFESPGATIDNGAISIQSQEICKVEDIKLLGRHNWQNICAAITATWQITQDIAAMKSVIATFGGLEHRLTFVRELNGVKYYDDSFGTNPETAIVAIDAFLEPKIVIAGGSYKGSDYLALAQKIIDSNVKHVIAIGVTGNKIADLLEAKKDERCVTYTVSENPNSWTMQQIVDAAREQAEPGDIVLLSTGSASFGLFKNYKDRGEQFQKAVKALV